MYNLKSYFTLNAQNTDQAYEYLLDNVILAFNNRTHNKKLLEQIEVDLPYSSDEHLTKIGSEIDKQHRTFLHKSVLAKSLPLTRIFLKFTNPFILDKEGKMAIHYTLEEKTALGRELLAVFIQQQCLITHKKMRLEHPLNIHFYALFLGNIESSEMPVNVIYNRKTLKKFISHSDNATLELLRLRFQQFTQVHKNNSLFKLKILSRLINTHLFPLLQQDPLARASSQKLFKAPGNRVSYQQYAQLIDNKLNLFNEAQILFNAYINERNNILKNPLEQMMITVLALCNLLLIPIAMMCAICAGGIYVTLGCVAGITSTINPSFTFSDTVINLCFNFFMLLLFTMGGAIALDLTILGIGGGLILAPTMIINALNPHTLAALKEIEDAHLHNIFSLFKEDEGVHTVRSVIDDTSQTMHERITEVNSLITTTETKLAPRKEALHKKIPQSNLLPFFNTQKITLDARKIERRNSAPVRRETDQLLGSNYRV